MNQATSIESLEGILTGLRQHIETLQSASDRVTSRVGDAFNKAQLRTTQLERLHETCNIVRSIIRIFYLSNRLQPYADSDTLPAKELPKIAGYLQELREIAEETADLSGIETVAKDLALIPKLQKSVVNTARLVLLQGLKMHNQAQIGTALQTYYHLKSLPSQIDRLFQQWIETAEKAIDALSEVPKVQAKTAEKGPPGGAGISQTPSSVILRANLWTNVEKLSETFNNLYGQHEVLVAVVAKKRDPMTHRLFTDEIPMEKLEEFWLDCAEKLKKNISGNLSGLIENLKKKTNLKLILKQIY